MVEVIGQDYEILKKCTCKNCGAILRYKQTEIKTLWSGPDGASGFKCPKCGTNVIITRWITRW